MSKEIGDEIDALLRFYSGRKLIAVTDIKEFSRVYVIMQEQLKHTVVFNRTTDEDRNG